MENLSRPPRRKWKTVLSGLLILFLIAAAWTAISRNPYAQGVRALFGRTPDQTIIDHVFSVGPHSFRYYKFTLPEGSTHMAVVGQFRVLGESGDDTIEILVLGEDQLNQWQTGASVRSIYTAGRVSQGTVRVDLPSGSGSYCLVFSNKLSTAGPKKVTATFVLRHNNWWR
ncbi:MAG TPA: hypothetical protein VHW45_11070 [Candidatus Sulfotelmatobacter sp.]|jgi:hypothetical protein|nr:hypothetical protein [Candidatus Sulfotelmatobacter sp.]